MLSVSAAHSRRLCRGRISTLRRHYQSKRASEPWKELGTIPAEQLITTDGQLRRRREHGKKDLPIPPMLDEEYDAARSGNKQSKEQLDWSQRSLFQAQLEHNPFAQALASPIRRCSITELRLPRQLMQSFSFYTNREDHKGNDWPEDTRVAARPTANGEHVRFALGKNVYTVLDQRVLSCLRRKGERSHMLTPTMQDRLAERVGHGTGKRSKIEVLWDAHYMDSVEDLLVSRVQTLLDTIIKHEKPAPAGRKLEKTTGLYVTFGATQRYAEMQQDGLMHYLWPSWSGSADFRAVVEASGCRTIVIAATERSAKLGMALRRLLDFTAGPEQDPELNAEAKAAMQEWRSACET